ncbi:MAG: TrpR-like protein, YerC/YecD [Clostridia bacterium]|nr:TrpR-like protein, YerC/YecD [Clostridia bacterium]
MKNNLQDENMQNLMRAILTLETEEECMRFLRDLCTVSELKSMSQRLEVAMKLRSGAVYTDIAAATGASTATISRVSRSLSYGENGYNTVLERLDSAK